MKNLALAQSILKHCWKHGVREIVLCAGARNAPFVKLLSETSPFKVYSFFEERSASFFALGRMQASRRPVVVITTSGTAVAELLPACIEADFQGLPLVMITADRPKRYRGSGAPQTIMQPGIFSHYVGASYDVEGQWENEGFALLRPVHLNVCFDEPLLAGEIVSWELGESFRAEKSAPENKLSPVELCRPLVIVSGLSANEAERLAPVLAQWQRPLFLEGTSRLRGHPLLHEWQIEGGEKTIAKLDIDGVIRVGAVPTLRYWRDLEASHLPVLHFSSGRFSGLPRIKEIGTLAQLGHQNFEPWEANERSYDRALAERREELLAQFPLSEPSWVAWVSRQIPSQARLFVGNSLPIREWDFAASFESTRDIFANRGTNGIDGLISTFIGAADEGKSNWALLGDLSALYDLSGPWALRQRPLDQFNLVVMNNGGGQIFNRMFHHPLFLNSHNLQFGDWAKMWDLAYVCLRDQGRDQGRELVPGRQVIEIVPDSQQTGDFWKAWDQI